MPRPPSQAIATRNDLIYTMWRDGKSLVAIAAEIAERGYDKVTPQRCGQVVASFHPEGEETDDRALFRGYMWRLFDEVQQIGDNPGFKMRPDGNPAYGPDDEIALDTNVQVQAKELQLKILRELRLLDARDKIQPKVLQMQLGPAEQAAMADIERRRREMEDLARKAGTIPGEVIRELPPSPGSAEPGP